MAMQYLTATTITTWLLLATMESVKSLLHIKKKGSVNIVIMRTDYYVYISCVNGNCPLLVEESKYGSQISTCKEYCGEDTYSGCNDCYFNGSPMCKECIHEEDATHERK